MEIINQYGGYVIIIVVITIIAEFFGRSKHIGFWWSFWLLLCGFIPGIIALSLSPSAKGSHTKANKNYNYFAGLFILLAMLSSIKHLGIAICFFVIATYLYSLSKGKVINLNPKYYFTKPTKEEIKKEKEDNLEELFEAGILTEEEYKLKKGKLNTELLEEELLANPIYKKLLNLKNEKLLSKEEFEVKVELLRQSYNSTNEKNQNVGEIKNIISSANRAFFDSIKE